jgi:hypothetical protein
MFADPLILVSTIDRTNAELLAGAELYTTFACTGRGPNSSTYRCDYSPTHWLEVFIGNQSGRRKRSTVRLTESEVVADPLEDTKNSVKTNTMSIVIDNSLLGPGTKFDDCAQMLSFFLYSGSDNLGVSYARRLSQGET